MSISGSNESATVPSRHWFATTHWSVVLSAADTQAPGSQAALEELCRTYWYPLYAYARRQGHSPEDAQDLTQEFFARFLHRKSFRAADRERGRFRSFLLTAMKHFLINEWERAGAQKRGGREAQIPLDAVAAEANYTKELAHELTADRIYERSWALAMLRCVHDRLKAEYASENKSDRFALLEQFLPGPSAEVTYSQAGLSLGVPEGTIKSEVSRLKGRYRDLLRREIAQTVAGPEEIEDELRYLINVLGAT